LGYRPLFYGAFREKDLPATDTWDSVEVQRVGGYFPLLNGKRMWLYVSSVARFWAGTVRALAKERPTFVHASDFEAVVPSAVFCALFGRPLIYNIHDNL